MKKAYWMVSGAVLAIGVGAGVAMINPQASDPGPDQADQTGNTEVEVADKTQTDSSSEEPSTTESSTNESSEAASKDTSTQPDSEKQPDKPKAQLTNQSKIAIDGIGPVRVGMTVAEASKSAGVELITSGDAASEGCFYFEPLGDPKNLGFMVFDDRIVRVDVWLDSTITTLSGAGVGSTEAQIRALYPGQIEESPHPYVEGSYLTFVPNDQADQNYRIIFETNSEEQVTSFRSGELPAVEWIEGCA